MPHQPRRSRLAYAALLLLTVALGLATRSFPAAFPEFIATYAGDALWAAAVYWGLAMIWPAARVWLLASGAGAMSLAVELSQLYQAPWLDAIRSSLPGRLVLGRGFLWSDLACYAASLALAAVADLIVCQMISGRRGPSGTL